MIRISLETRGTSEISRLVNPAILEKAMNQAASKAVQGIKPIAKESIIEEFTIKPSKILGRRGRIWGYSEGTNAIVDSKGERIGLIHYKHSPTQPMHGKTSGGVLSEVRRGEIRHLPHSFINIERHGNMNGVFHRESSKRLPIYQNHGSSLPEMLSANSVSKRISNILIRKYESELARNLT